MFPLRALMGAKKGKGIPRDETRVCGDDCCGPGRCSPGFGTAATCARAAGPRQRQLGPPAGRQANHPALTTCEANGAPTRQHWRAQARAGSQAGRSRVRAIALTRSAAKPAQAFFLAPGLARQRADDFRCSTRLGKGKQPLVSLRDSPPSRQGRDQQAPRLPPFRPSHLRSVLQRKACRANIR
jgi:hypothetical protein